MTLRGVILDIDGTLIDSNDAHAHSWIEAMSEQGYSVDFDKVRPLIGMGGDKVLPAVLNISKDSSEGKKMDQRCGGWSDADLKGAIAIYDDPADLLAHYGESPLAQNTKTTR